MNPIQLPVRRPLLPITAVMGILDQNEDQVLRLVEAGKLAWAFDLRSPKTNRACLRIVAQCVSDFLAGTATLGKNESFAAVVDYLFPYHTETVRLSRLTRVFNCSSEHLHCLLAQGCLRPVRPGRRGPKDSPEIQFASVVQFLKTRRYLN